VEQGSAGEQNPRISSSGEASTASAEVAGHDNAGDEHEQDQEEKKGKQNEKHDKAGVVAPPGDKKPEEPSPTRRKQRGALLSEAPSPPEKLGGNKKAPSRGRGRNR